MIPGEYAIKEGKIKLNEGRPTVVLTIANTGDRPIQVGSQYRQVQIRGERLKEKITQMQHRAEKPVSRKIPHQVLT